LGRGGHTLRIAAFCFRALISGSLSRLGRIGRLSAGSLRNVEESREAIGFVARIRFAAEAAAFVAERVEKSIVEKRSLAVALPAHVEIENGDGRLERALGIVASDLSANRGQGLAEHLPAIIAERGRRRWFRFARRVLGRLRRRRGFHIRRGRFGGGRRSSRLCRIALAHRLHSSRKIVGPLGREELLEAHERFHREVEPGRELRPREPRRPPEGGVRDVRHHVSAELGVHDNGSEN
jgi:hypothetical protein